MSANETLDLSALKAMGADKPLTDAELAEWTGWLTRRYDAHLSNMSCRRLVVAVRERDAEIARLIGYANAWSELAEHLRRCADCADGPMCETAHALDDAILVAALRQTGTEPPQPAEGV